MSADIAATMLHATTINNTRYSNSHRTMYTYILRVYLNDPGTSYTVVLRGVADLYP